MMRPMRRVFALAVLILAASCGGGSMSPTVSTPLPALPSGAYVLNVSIGGAGGQFMFCVSTGTLDIGGLSTNVELQHTGGSVTIQPDDATATFRMDLQMSGDTLSGTASGQFLSTGRVVAVAGQGASTAEAVGTASSSGAGGNLTGNVSANTTSGTVGAGGIVSTSGLACNSGNWSVTPR
jgi:hypothetical protein